MPLSEAEQTLCAFVARRDRAMRDDLAQHVAIPTGHAFEPGLSEYRGLLIARLEALGALVRLERGDARPAWLDVGDAGHPGEAASGEPQPIVIAERRAAQPGVPRVLVAGHIDTVHDPRSAFRELTTSADGSTAIGPGAADMKGGIVVALHALEVLAEAGVDLSWTVLLNSDEERGSFESARVIRETAAEHDIGIAVEPALPSGALAIERMGSGQFMVEVFGQAAHVGREFTKGVSAVTKLGDLLAALAKLADPAAGRILNVGPLRGGSAANIVPDNAACWGNVRFRDERAAEALAGGLDALATADDAMPRVAVHRVWNRPAKPASDAVLALAETARVAAEDLGQTLPFEATGGVCDGNIMQDAGLPTLDTLGVRGGNLHRKDEFIELASLVDRCQLLAVLLARIATRSLALH
jgi:glutamate carboxypeptidase